VTPRSPLIPLGCSDFLNGGEDVWVRAAAAQVAAHALAYIGVRRPDWLAQQGDGGDDLPRRAVAALKPVAGQKRGLHWVQVVAVRQPLDGRDLLAPAGDGERQARIDTLPVH